MASSLQDYSAANRTDPPRHLGSRYNEAGNFLNDPGNTVVCHLRKGSATEAALLAVRERIRRKAVNSMAFTAPASLHMTLFQGVLDRRRSPSYWPEGVALDTSVHAITELFAKRLVGFEPGPALTVEAVAVLPSGIIVDGVTPADRHALADWRNRLADLFGYRHPDHDSYEFHITYAYPISWIASTELDSWQALLDEALVFIRLAAPILELNAPALCSFEDMNRFDELVILGAEAMA